MDDFQLYETVAKIKIIGVGGAGNNAVNCMVEDQVIGCEFYVMNTDAQVLSCSKANNRIILGKKTTKGLGAGANPSIGKEAAIESENEIREVVKDTDMVFVAAGMGGGTGTGAAPIVAKIAKEEGALVVGIVTRPFTFEGKTRMNNAILGIEEIKKYVDTLIIISNDRILQLIGNLPLRQSFKEADNVLRKSVQAITDLIALPALINLDFADVKTLLNNKGAAMIGFGVGNGDNRAQEAAAKAITSPLLEHSINGAKSAIIAITGGQNSTLYDFTDAVDYIRNAAGNDINIIFVASINENLEDEIQVTVIATDFDDDITESQFKPIDITFKRKPVGEQNEEKKDDKEDKNDLKPSFF